MNILIRNTSDQPIYEQIARQIREAIVSGELAPGEALPSIRALARDLRISVITTKRAYEELEHAGYVDMVAGKGCFVAQRNAALMRETQLRQVEEHLREAARLARPLALSQQELMDMLALAMEGDWYERN